MMACGDLTDEEWDVIAGLLPSERGRNRIERLFGQLKQSRRIATRYNKAALSFASFLNLAAICKWLPHFVSTGPITTLAEV